MEPEAYYDLTSITEVALSPCGERVAFVTGEFDEENDERRSSIWTVPADGSGAPYRLTRASDAGNPAWSPGGRYLAFTAAREEDVDLAVAAHEESPEEGDEADGDGDGGSDGPETQVWVFDLERGGDARQVTDRDWGVDSFDWGPTGDRIVVAARDPTEEEASYLEELDDDGPIEIERLQHKQNGTGYLDDVTTYLFVVDVDTRETTRLDAANDRGFGTGSGGLQPAWGEDRIAFCGYGETITNPDDTAVRDVFTIRPDGTGHTRVTHGELNAGRPSWGPDGTRLAFAGRPPENFYVPTELYVTDDDRTEYRSVSQSLDRTLGYSEIRWIDESKLVATIGDEGLTRVCTFDPDEDVPDPAFPGEGSMETIARGRGIDVAAGTLVYVRSIPDDGTDIFATGTDPLTDTGDGTRLTTVNDELIASHEQPSCRRITIATDDDETVEAFAYVPDDVDLERDAPPLLLKIHGGPMAYDDPSWGFDETFWTGQGYLVLEVNYRGSTSYGRAFCEELRGAWNDREVEDLIAGVDTVVKRGWVDENRLFCTGFSQGGVNTGYLVTTTDRFSAAAAEHGIFDLYSSFGTDDSQVWLTADNGVPWENEQRYLDQSSITDVGAVDTPTLVTAGERDWRCPPSQSEQFYVSLRKQGVDAKLVIYQGEHHAISTPDRAVHRLSELRAWFDDHR